MLGIPHDLAELMLHQHDPNYIIVKRQMDRHETDVLFEHTRKIRALRRGQEGEERGRYNELREENSEFLAKLSKGLLQSPRVDAEVLEAEIRDSFD